MQVTYINYDTFNLMHTHMWRFMKDCGLEGAYHWQDIIQYQDFKDLEAKMMLRKKLNCMS